MTTVKNRNPIKQWFITLPQSGAISREEFAKTFPPSSGVICCEEKHQDGHPHLHLLIVLKKAISFAKLKDWVREKFPDNWKRIDIGVAKSLTNCVDYCQKEDPTCYRTGDILKEKGKKNFCLVVGHFQHVIPPRHVIEELLKKYDICENCLNLCNM